MRLAAKRDANEKAIVAALRKAGCLVLFLSGPGTPDLLVARGWLLRALEVKRPKGRLTKAQEARKCEGWPVTVVRTPEEALSAVGLVPLPDCDKCGSNERVVEVGPDTMGTEFRCKKCRLSWAQST